MTNEQPSITEIIRTDDAFEVAAKRLHNATLDLHRAYLHGGDYESCEQVLCGNTKRSLGELEDAISDERDRLLNLVAALDENIAEIARLTERNAKLREDLEAALLAFAKRDDEG